jgi:hypothetical protein
MTRWPASGRRQALRARCWASFESEGVVGDLGDGEAAVSGCGEQLGDPVLDPARPFAHG